MSIPNFWNQKHPLSSVASELFDKLVPDVGHCGTLQGELLRASNKILWDWYNNGWGCNNWSGAVKFIASYLHTLPIKPLPMELASLDRALNIVHEYSHGEPCHISDETADDLVTTIHEIIVATLINNPVGIHNPCDMYDLQEEDHQWENNTCWDDEEGDY